MKTPSDDHGHLKAEPPGPDASAAGLASAAVDTSAVIGASPVVGAPRVVEASQVFEASPGLEASPVIEASVTVIAAQESVPLDPALPEAPDSAVLHRLIRDVRFRERSRSRVRFPPADPPTPGLLPVGFAGSRPPTPLPRIPTAISSRAAHPSRARHGTVLDAHEASLSSPWGTLTVLASAAGVVRLSFVDSGDGNALPRLASGLRVAPERSRLHVERALEQLREYIAHKRRRFELPIDLGPFGLYHREVLSFLPRLRYGHTVSYGELATATGRPLAMRAVGAACALNPVPIIFPCHRVIHADGSLGGHIAGTWVKHALLTHEGVFDE